LPTDLALFDHRSKQTLIGDLEVIPGKRLTFPFIEKLKGKKEKRKESQAKRVSRTLKKERDHKWEDDFAWEGVRLLDEEKSSRRAASEGNWI
jgi:hypothetical protein